MTVELRPLGVKCNIQCQYCYQNPQRDAGNILREYDMDVMMRAVEEEGGPFALFGGEPLMMPLPDLEKLWDWGMTRFGENSVQTNGVLITDAHIELFEKYDVHVGISIDGPADLNDARWAGSEKGTRQTTAKVEATIRTLCERKRPPTLIITLHRGNASRDKLPRMCEWLMQLEALGIRAARLHLLEVDHATIRQTYALSSEENCAAVRSFADLESRLTTLKLDLFDDIRRMLAGDDDGVTCVWGACDPYTTSAVRGVEGNGQRSNCGRTNKDGIDFAKADQEGFERYLALYHTPQKHGGCQGCRFFLFCKGQCPGTSLDNDWRNRSEHCAVWMESYERIESDLVNAGRTPLSLSPDRHRLEEFFLSAWESGHNTSLKHALANVGRVETPTQTELFPVEPDSPRLGFELPAFARIAWTSDAARAAWQSRLDKLRTLSLEMEWRSVAAGLRPAAILAESAAPEDWRRHGLECRPLGEGRIAVGRAGTLEDLEAAIAARDPARIGDLLGTPECCRSALQSLWLNEELQDPTWHAARATAGVIEENDVVAADGHPLVHGLWRWFGIRPVAHLACRFDCPATGRLAEAIVERMRALGYEREMNWLEEIHAWPMEWSSLHGIAEIRSPIVKVSAKTDALAARRVARWRGLGQFPAEAAKGIRFPYLQPLEPLFTRSAAYRRGLANSKSSTAGLVPLGPIHRDTLAILEAGGACTGRSVAEIALTPYFCTVTLDDGSVGAAMSYFTPEETDWARQRLPMRSAADPLGLEWLFRNPELAEQLEMPPDRACLVAHTLRTALLSALTAPKIACGGDDAFTVQDRLASNPFQSCRRAVVIGFGGYIDQFAATPNIQHLHICDLGYNNRRAEMDAFAAASPTGRITLSDGADAEARIRDCDVVAITGSALCNGSLEQLLSWGAGRIVVVQGQSAAIHPRALFDRGVSFVATTRKPPELASLAASDHTGQSLRRFLEGGLPWIYLHPKAKN